VCNSVGGVVGLQAAVDRPDLIKGVFTLEIDMDDLEYVMIKDCISKFLFPFVMPYKNKG
jgi:hypothetical protein